MSNKYIYKNHPILLKKLKRVIYCQLSSDAKEISGLYSLYEPEEVSQLELSTIKGGVQYNSFDFEVYQL